MGTVLLGLVTVAYGWVAVTYWQQGRWGMCLAFIGYSLANIGFIWDIKLWEGK
jgi:hypothetical protein